jgi:hypothetical protein
MNHTNWLIGYDIVRCKMGILSSKTGDLTPMFILATMVGIMG